MPHEPDTTTSSVAEVLLSTVCSYTLAEGCIRSAWR